MTPIELKQYFEQNPPPATFELKPWAKIIDMERFLRGAYSELSNFKGDYNDCPSYWRLKDLHKELTKKQEKPSSDV